MDETYAQLSVRTLGLKLGQLSKLPDDVMSKELMHAQRELRDILITMGVRKRKVRKPKAEGETKSPKGSKKGK